jgi:hypothetical protein
MIPISIEEVRRQRLVLKVYDHIADTEMLGEEFHIFFNHRGLVGGEFGFAKNGRDIKAKFMYKKGDETKITNLYITPVDIFGDDENISDYRDFYRLNICERFFGREYSELCDKYDKRKGNIKAWETYIEDKNILLTTW